MHLNVMINNITFFRVRVCMSPNEFITIVAWSWQSGTVITAIYRRGFALAAINAYGTYA